MQLFAYCLAIRSRCSETPHVLDPITVTGINVLTVVGGKKVIYFTFITFVPCADLS